MRHDWVKVVSAGWTIGRFWGRRSECADCRMAGADLELRCLWTASQPTLYRLWTRLLLGAETSPTRSRSTCWESRSWSYSSTYLLPLLSAWSQSTARSLSQTKSLSSRLLLGWAVIELRSAPEERQLSISQLAHYYPSWFRLTPKGPTLDTHKALEHL